MLNLEHPLQYRIFQQNTDYGRRTIFLNSQSQLDGDKSSFRHFGCALDIIHLESASVWREYRFDKSVKHALILYSRGDEATNIPLNVAAQLLLASGKIFEKLCWKPKSFDILLQSTWYWFWIFWRLATEWF